VPEYLVNVMETYFVTAESEDAVYDVPREEWVFDSGDIMIVEEVSE